VFDAEIGVDDRFQFPPVRRLFGGPQSGARLGCSGVEPS
jgi:hypothetical protein